MLDFPRITPSTWSQPVSGLCLHTHPPVLPLCQGSANSSSLPRCSGTFPTLQVLGAQVPSVCRLSLAKLQPSLQKIILGDLGRSVINLQLVGGERREC